MKSMKKGQGIVALIAMVVLIGLLGWYSFGIVSNTIKGNGKGLKLGLDLAGGVSITYEAQGDKAPSDADMEDTITKLKNRMDELGLKAEDYEFYTDLRKYGSTRHSGFGLGFERCVMYLTGMGNIRDVVPFPRTVKNCDL